MCILRNAVVAGLVLVGSPLSGLVALGQDQAKMNELRRILPDTISPEVRAYLQSLPDPATLPEWPHPHNPAAWQKKWEETEAANGSKVEAILKRYEPVVQLRRIGGVRCLDIKPKGWKDNGKLLVHAHGGAYALFSARSRLTSSVPVAQATGLRVVSVDYSLAPFGKWGGVTDEVLRVLVTLRDEGTPLKNIAVCGESAGGALVASAVLKMRDRELGMPGAVVLWSPWADIANRGDSAVTMKNFDPFYIYDRDLKQAAEAYAPLQDQKSPYVSPVYGDYSKGFPPTLIQGGTRELFLSHFVRLYRAIDGAGGTAVLDLYDGMPHIFQLRPELADAPETRVALDKVNAFLKRSLAY
jgi:acetyl esterase/lipase